MTQHSHRHAGHMARNGARRRAGVATRDVSWSTAGRSNGIAPFAGYPTDDATKLRTLRPPEPSP
jgi:hypothetical protein